MYLSLSSERTIKTEKNFEYSRPHGGTMFLSSSKEHALFSLKEEEMLGGIETQHDHTSMHPTVLPHSARIAEQLY